MMRMLAAAAAGGLLLIVLADAFETIVVARRAQRIFRITRIFYELTWAPIAAAARRIQSGGRRERYLGIYGPLSLLILLGSWAIGLIFGFALLQWAIGFRIDGKAPSFAHLVYFSASTFFTLALSEPANGGSRLVMVTEAALGYTFLGLVIGYPPLLYQHFSAREVRIALLDARAGSPPSAAALVIRQGDHPSRLERQLAEWEAWEAEIIQSHLSYPILAYFRSQHANQSWLGTLTAVVDASALILIGSAGDLQRQAELTFAMGRHALVDLAAVFGTPPRQAGDDRLPHAEWMRLREVLAASDTALPIDRLSEPKLQALRATYEPFAGALASHFLIALPPWIAVQPERDNWERTSWDRSKETFAVSDPFQAGEHERPRPSSF